jgi:hypothetical protein
MQTISRAGFLFFSRVARREKADLRHRVHRFFSSFAQHEKIAAS